MCQSPIPVKTKGDLVLFMGWAIIQARLLCRYHHPIEQIGDLLDAIHNFAGVIARDNESEVMLLTKDLEFYDGKWEASSSKPLLTTFRKLVSGNFNGPAEGPGKDVL